MTGGRFWHLGVLVARFRGCAYGSGNATALQYEAFLGPWEMGEVGRPWTAQGRCTEWVSMDSDRRCVQWDQDIRYRNERRTRPIVLGHPGP